MGDMGVWIVLGVFALFGIFMATLLVMSNRAEAERVRVWDAFMDRHGLRRGNAAGKPWSKLFLFELGSRSEFSEVLEGEVDGVALTLCNTSAGLSGDNSKSSSVGTMVGVSLETTDLPECYLLPVKMGGLFTRMLEMVAPAVGIRLFKVPEQPELGKLYTVIGRANADLDSTLGRLDLLNLLAEPAQPMAFGPGGLAVFPEVISNRWLRMLDSEEELEALLRSALKLRKVVSGLA